MTFLVNIWQCRRVRGHNAHGDRRQRLEAERWHHATATSRRRGRRESPVQPLHGQGSRCGRGSREQVQGGAHVALAAAKTEAGQRHLQGQGLAQVRHDAVTHKERQGGGLQVRRPEPRDFKLCFLEMCVQFHSHVLRVCRAVCLNVCVCGVTCAHPRVAITRKDGVPLYGPHFEGDVFPRNQQFRDFLFYKRTWDRSFHVPLCASCPSRHASHHTPFVW